MTSNSALLMRQFQIADIFADAPHAAAIDGSLWTLFYEAVCYALVGHMGILGVLHRRPGLLSSPPVCSGHGPS